MVEKAKEVEEGEGEVGGRRGVVVQEGLGPGIEVRRGRRRKEIISLFGIAILLF